MRSKAESTMFFIGNLRKCKYLPFSLLGNVIIHLFVKVLSKVRRNKETFQFCRAH